MAPVLVYDDGKGQLAPLTDLRAVFDVRTGALTTLERLARSLGAAPSLVVPESIADLTRERHPDLSVNAEPPVATPMIAINGRWTGPFPGALQDLKPGSALVERGTGEVLAASVQGRALERVLAGDTSGLDLREHDAPECQVLTRPWHVKSCRDSAIRHDLRLLTGHSSHTEHRTIARIDPSAKVHPTAVLDTEHGSIVIEAGAVVRPQAVIIGPAFIGPHSTVLEGAVIRGNTAIGPWCKAAGEVAGVIFQGYANKAHDGFLGDSWVGEWVNLGAGTTNSNLLNTYGEVIARAQPRASSERTGEKFLGAVIGDHVKAAICSRIMTGCVVHTGTMWAAAAAMDGCIAPFTWRTEEANRQFRLSRFLDVARAMMARRSVTPTSAYEARLAELHSVASAYFNTPA